MPDNSYCPLCREPVGFLGRYITRRYYQCSGCGSVFPDRHRLPSPDEEKERYLLHNNDVNDSRYQRFVKPVTDGIKQLFTPAHKGLDYGAGSGPVITKVLRDAGYDISVYDPFFFDRPETLKQRYDYIACCEVIEHFFDPYREFQQLKHLLKANGKLFCMTELYHADMTFQDWHYKNDSTHVFLYSCEAIQWISKTFQFRSVQINNRLITFENSAENISCPTGG
jgi:SAM-dependent methyltransferase